jgi:isoquinoline 1-oxidoreductase beta subunit
MRSDSKIVSASRRRFLATGPAATAGLVVGFYAPKSEGFFATMLRESRDDVFSPNAFLRVAPDNTVTVVSKHAEGGQGVYTGLATIIAEELDADWSQVRVEAAPADRDLYKNLQFGSQGTGGSNSIANSYEQYRRAGATARAMLVAAAADRWSVPSGEITVEKGLVRHAASRRQASFGKLAQAAASVPAPRQVTLKDPKNFKLIGAEHLPRLDSRAKTTGKAVFAIDYSLPDMAIALVARPPFFGATVKTFDASKTKAVPGVLDAVQISTGVAVVATSFPGAQRGRDALRIEWDESKAEHRGTPELLAEYRRLLQQPGSVARRDGDCAQALARATRTVSATFEFPYLAHATMEPLSAAVRLSANQCDVWTADWDVSGVQDDAARITGLTTQQVHIHTLYGGGSFGRRGSGASEVVEVAKAVGGRFPVKLFWTREDDMRGDAYRPMYLHKLDAGLDEQGNLIAWQHRVVGQSVLGSDPNWIINGIDITSVAGASNIPYDIPNILVDLHSPVLRVPINKWRSVGNSHNAFAVETFLDDVAHVAGRDPYQFRRALLMKDPRDKPMLLVAPDRMKPSLFAKFPRDRRVLELVGEKSGWGTSLPPRKGRGLAVHYSFRSSVAQVAEVTVGSDGGLKVDRVVCAVDCGVAINPDVIRAQMEGGVAFGLSAILYGAITLKNGKVEQSNFDDYQVLRMNEMPKVEVHIVGSDEPPTGIGESVVPPIGPALSNAIFAVTGKRVRTLPLYPNIQAGEVQ